MPEDAAPLACIEHPKYPNRFLHLRLPKGKLCALQRFLVKRRAMLQVM
jgi:hypothetical protein